MFNSLLKNKSLRDSRSGMAMVIVLCVMVLLLSIGASMLVAGTAAMGNTDMQIKQEQAYQNCCSLSRVIIKELNRSGSAMCTKALTLSEGGSFSFSAKNTDTGDMVCEIGRAEDNYTCAISSTVRGATYAMKLVVLYDAGVWKVDRYED